MFSVSQVPSTRFKTRHYILFRLGNFTFFPRPGWFTDFTWYGWDHVIPALQQHWAQRHKERCFVNQQSNDSQRGINAHVVAASSWKEYTHMNMCCRNTLLFLLRLEPQPDLGIKAAEEEDWKEARRFFSFFWIACELLTTWSETCVDLTAHLDPPLLTLIHLPPSSLSLIVVARVSIKKLAAHLQLMVDKPSRPGWTWTRLLFIPSPPAPLTSTTAQFLLAGLNLYP